MIAAAAAAVTGELKRERERDRERERERERERGRESEREERETRFRSHNCAVLQLADGLTGDWHLSISGNQPGRSDEIRGKGRF